MNHLSKKSVKTVYIPMKFWFW